MRLTRRRFLAGVAATGVGLGALTGSRASRSAGVEVDTALVLAVDSSTSVDLDEFTLQMNGLAAAFRDEAVVAAALGGSTGKTAVLLLEWSNANWQRVNIPWTLLASPADCAALATEMENAPRLIYGGGTAIGSAIDFALRQFRNAPAAGRKVIDVSGDGRANLGRKPALARDAAVRAGVTVNGLAIVNEEADLVAHFEAEVIGGPGAFVIEAKDYDDFRRAIREKLLQELAAPIA